MLGTELEQKKQHIFNTVAVQYIRGAGKRAGTEETQFFFYTSRTAGVLGTELEQKKQQFCFNILAVQYSRSAENRAGTKETQFIKMSSTAGVLGTELEPKKQQFF